MSESLKKYVVYAHINNINNEVFYVGKGTIKENSKHIRHFENSKSRRNNTWHSYVDKIDSNYRVEIVKEFSCEKEALKYEKELQTYYWSINQCQCSLLHGKDWIINNLELVKNKERNRKISEALKGTKMSEECKQKLSSVLKGRYCRESNPNKKSVQQFSKEGELIQTFESLSEASRAVGGYASHISRVCNGTLKTHKGFLWKYSN